MGDQHNLRTQWLWCFSFILSFSVVPLSTSENSITINTFITTNQTIISEGGKFALGFFTPKNSTNTYLGIWFNTIPKRTVIWVANRASPIPKNSPQVFKLSQGGNLVILSGSNVVWTSNVSVVSSTLDSLRAVLLDNGNLVIRHGEKDDNMWQSFDHPTDTFVPDMKFSLNKQTGQQIRLTSWVNDEDPRPGLFSIGIDANEHQFYILKGNELYWRSDVYAVTTSFHGRFIEIDKGSSVYINYVVQEDELYIVSSNSVRTRFTLSPSGKIQSMVLVKTGWVVLWQAPLATCDYYGYCGPFTICQNNESRPLCKCLTGFYPKSLSKWNAGNWSSGCVRNKELSCNEGDGFLKYERMKLPDHAVIIKNKTVGECEFECFNNCSCTAYAYENVTNEVTLICLNWFRELVDITSNFGTGHKLYVKVHNSKLAGDSQERNSPQIRSGVIAAAVAIISTGLLIINVFGYFWRRERQIRKEKIKSELLGFDSMSTTSGVSNNSVELVSFSLRSVLAATDSFSVKNKLGEGGFGPVYKGSLPGDRKVAVKRLSTSSSQGQVEFVNELKLIAKLQHTNLVRLLGCCVEEKEKIILYEYMPNRSLDKYLFDPSKSVNLDWDKRFKIIEGIAQGLLYLHKYSRLRVIHRDLKASNVLLDQTMTPKISDFGLARIFEMNQIEDKTSRVVGTFGYMAPEYALHGRFSERSDVFSFGVLLLQIVTGKRNTVSDYMEDTLTVSEWAWKKLKEDRGIECIDPSMRGTCNPTLAVKCINVGLLCVQENMNERPNMSEVVVMLSNETAIVPLPKKPAFTLHTSPQISSNYSINEGSVTNVEPR